MHYWVRFYMASVKIIDLVLHGKSIHSYNPPLYMPTYSKLSLEPSQISCNSMNSSRISLRPFKLSDANDFLKWASDDKVTRYLRWNTITSREEALTYIEKLATHPWRQSICLDDQSIGYVSVKPEQSDDMCRAHVSYVVSAEYWGQGIATVALRMAMCRVFRELPCLVRIEALVEVENKGSQRVLEKVGFLKEGLLRKYGYCKGEIRDMFIYSFLSTDKIM